MYHRKTETTRLERIPLEVLQDFKKIEVIQSERYFYLLLMY